MNNNSAPLKSHHIIVHHVLVDDAIVLCSLIPVTLDELREWHWFNPNCQYIFESAEREVPYQEGRTELWEGGFPHVHYDCCHCGYAHNFDLDSNDENPRLAVCDDGTMGEYTLVSWVRINAT